MRYFPNRIAGDIHALDASRLDARPRELDARNRGNRQIDLRESDGHLVRLARSVRPTAVEIFRTRWNVGTEHQPKGREEQRALDRMGARGRGVLRLLVLGLVDDVVTHFLDHVHEGLAGHERRRREARGERREAIECWNE